MDGEAGRMNCRSAGAVKAGCMLAALAASFAAHAGPSTIEITVADECGEQAPAVIESSDVLNGVARDLAGGLSLNAAIDRAGYDYASVDSLYFNKEGGLGGDGLGEVVKDQYCTSARDRPFTEFGTYGQRNEAWLVLATPAKRPALDDAARIAARVLELVNAAREHSRRCGDREVPPARPLSISASLTEAAERHARDMAQQGRFTHVGSDGSHTSERVSDARYRWRSVGENIAVGQTDAETVVEAWLESPEHCANLMGRQFREMGVGFAIAPPRGPAVYWAQVFAAPL